MTFIPYVSIQIFCAFRIASLASTIGSTIKSEGASSSTHVNTKSERLCGSTSLERPDNNKKDANKKDANEMSRIFVIFFISNAASLLSNYIWKEYLSIL